MCLYGDVQGAAGDTACTIPTKVDQLQLFPLLDNTGFGASWRPVADPAPSGYEAQYRASGDDDAVWTPMLVDPRAADNLATAATIGPTPGRSYEVRVRSADIPDPSQPMVRTPWLQTSVTLPSESDDGDPPPPPPPPPAPRRPPPPPVPRVTVSFAQATYEAEEGGLAVAVTVQLSAAPERAVTIPLTATPGGGATAADYRVVPDSVTFGEDSTVAVVTVAALADAETDAGESVVLGFGGLPARVVGAGQVAAEVALVDTTVTVFFERPSYMATEGGAGAEVTVRLGRPPAQAVTVPLTATPGGGATAADYTGVPASVTFDLADTLRTFPVTAPADEDDDDGESVSIGFGTLSAALIAGSPTSATVTLADAGGRGSRAVWMSACR